MLTGLVGEGGGGGDQKWVRMLALAWPLGILAAVFYAIFSPFAACCAPCTDFTNFLMEHGVKLPYTAASNMVHGRAGC